MFLFEDLAVCIYLRELATSVDLRLCSKSGGHLLLLSLWPRFRRVYSGEQAVFPELRTRYLYLVLKLCKTCFELEFHNWRGRKKRSCDSPLLNILKGCFIQNELGNILGALVIHQVICHALLSDILLSNLIKTFMLYCF